MTFSTRNYYLLKELNLIKFFLPSWRVLAYFYWELHILSAHKTFFQNIGFSVFWPKSIKLDSFKSPIGSQ